MGFVLKKLEGDSQKLQNLRDRLYFKFGGKGLRIAEFVQSGIFSKYIGILLERTKDEKEIEEEIQDMIDNTEKFTLFVQMKHDAETKGREVITRINANLPKAFIICSRGQAIDIAIKIATNTMKEIDGYDIETQKTTDKLYIFIIKTDSLQTQNNKQDRGLPSYLNS